MLAKKVDTLNKAMEVEARKMRREVAAMEKEVSAIRINNEHEQRTRRASAPRGAVTGTRSISAARYIYVCVTLVLLAAYFNTKTFTTEIQSPIFSSYLKWFQLFLNGAPFV